MEQEQPKNAVMSLNYFIFGFVLQHTSISPALFISERRLQSIISIIYLPHWNRFSQIFWTRDWRTQATCPMMLWWWRWRWGCWREGQRGVRLFSNKTKKFSRHVLAWLPACLAGPVKLPTKASPKECDFLSA